MLKAIHALGEKYSSVKDCQHELLNCLYFPKRYTVTIVFNLLYLLLLPLCNPFAHVCKNVKTTVFDVLETDVRRSESFSRLISKISSPPSFDKKSKFSDSQFNFLLKTEAGKI